MPFGTAKSRGRPLTPAARRCRGLVRDAGTGGLPGPKYFPQCAADTDASDTRIGEAAKDVDSTVYQRVAELHREILLADRRSVGVNGASVP